MTLLLQQFLEVGYNEVLLHCCSGYLSGVNSAMYVLWAVMQPYLFVDISAIKIVSLLT